MKAFVCIKQVPDSEAKIKIKPDASGIDPAGVKWVMNPYDEYAVEEGIKLKEAGKVTNVTVVTLGPKARAVEVLRTALAMGADDAIVIDVAEELDSTATAKALAAAIKAEGEFKYVLTGKSAADDNAAAVSQMVGEFLGVPHTTVVVKMETADANATVEREGEGGASEIVQLTLPAVVGATKGLNTPRFASLPGIMKAKKKPVKELTLAALGVAATEVKVRHTNFQMPPEKPPVKMIQGDVAAQANQLAKLLREEAKVI